MTLYDYIPIPVSQEAVQKTVDALIAIVERYLHLENEMEVINQCFDYIVIETLPNRKINWNSDLDTHIVVEIRHVLDKAAKDSFGDTNYDVGWLYVNLAVLDELFNRMSGHAQNNLENHIHLDCS